MKLLLLCSLLLPFFVFAQSKDKADKLYERYEPKPYVSGFSFGGSLLSVLPIDIDFDNGTMDRTLNGEMKRIQWLKISDERYLKEVTADWQEFLDHSGYKRMVVDDDDGDENFIYVRGSRTQFDEAHMLVIQEGSTTLLTVYGEFTLHKTPRHEH